MYNLRAEGGYLTIDRRSHEDIEAKGTKFQVLRCNVSSSWNAVPNFAPFNLTGLPSPSFAGLLEYDGKCLTVNGNAVSMEKCASTVDELVSQWVHFVSGMVVFAGNSNRTDARVALEGTRVTNITKADLDKKFDLLYLNGGPTNIVEPLPSDDSRDAGSIATVSPSLVALVAGVLFLSA